MGKLGKWSGSKKIDSRKKLNKSREPYYLKDKWNLFMRISRIVLKVGISIILLIGMALIVSSSIEDYANQRLNNWVEKQVDKSLNEYDLKQVKEYLDILIDGSKLDRAELEEIIENFYESKEDVYRSENKALREWIQDENSRISNTLKLATIIVSLFSIGGYMATRASIANIEVFKEKYDDINKKVEEQKKAFSDIDKKFDIRLMVDAVEPYPDCTKIDTYMSLIESCEDIENVEIRKSQFENVMTKLTELTFEIAGSHRKYLALSENIYSLIKNYKFKNYHPQLEIRLIGDLLRMMASDEKMKEYETYYLEVLIDNFDQAFYPQVSPLLKYSASVNTVFAYVEGINARGQERKWETERIAILNYFEYQFNKKGLKIDNDRNKFEKIQLIHTARLVSLCVTDISLHVDALENMFEFLDAEYGFINEFIEELNIEIILLYIELKLLKNEHSKINNVLYTYKEQIRDYSVLRNSRNDILFKRVIKKINKYILWNLDIDGLNYFVFEKKIDAVNYENVKERFEEEILTNKRQRSILPNRLNEQIFEIVSKISMMEKNKKESSNTDKRITRQLTDLLYVFNIFKKVIKEALGSKKLKIASFPPAFVYMLIDYYERLIEYGYEIDISADKDLSELLRKTYKSGEMINKNELSVRFLKNYIGALLRKKNVQDWEFDLKKEVAEMDNMILSIDCYKCLRLWGKLLYENGDVDKAIYHFGELERLFKLQWNFIVDEEKKDYDRKLKFYAKLLKARGDIYFERGEYDLGLDDYNLSIISYPDKATYNRLGRLYDERGLHLYAISYYNRANELSNQEHENDSDKNYYSWASVNLLANKEFKRTSDNDEVKKVLMNLIKRTVVENGADLTNIANGCITYIYTDKPQKIIRVSEDEEVDYNG